MDVVYHFLPIQSQLFHLNSSMVLLNNMTFILLRLNDFLLLKLNTLLFNFFLLLLFNLLFDIVDLMIDGWLLNFLLPFDFGDGLYESEEKQEKY